MFGLSKKYPKWFDDLPGDNQTLMQLYNLKADFNKPFEVDAYLYFATEENAKLAEKDAQALGGWKTNIHLNEKSQEWSLALHNDNFLINEDNMKKMRSEFESIAQKHQGDYDGWGAQINVPSKQR